MKLAEALQERADLNQKIQQLKGRLLNNVLVQEGEQPTESPEELMRELDSCITRLEYLIAKINLTNSAVRMDGKTLTDALSRKDTLSLKLSVYRDAVAAAGENTQRARYSEIKILPAVSVPELQKKVDAIAKELRQLDNQLQAQNWQTDLIE